MGFEGNLSVDWKLANVTSRRRDKRGFREFQVCQSDLSAGKGYGASHLECPHMAPTAQPGD